MEKLLSLWVDDLNKKHSVDSSCYDATVKKVQCRILTVLLTKTFVLSFEHIKLIVQY